MDSAVVPLPFSNQDLSIEDSGSMYVITTPAGLIIKWTHLTGIIDMCGSLDRESGEDKYMYG